MSQNNGPPPLELVCRIAPLKSEDGPACIVPDMDRYIRLIPPPGMLSRFGEPLVEKKFKFAHVFNENVSQNMVFKRCASDMIEGLFAGTNSLLFAYGVTGSGKTYTITGQADNGGILPRSLDYLFKGIQHALIDKCVFKSDGKNGYYVQTSSNAQIERERMPNLTRATDNFLENQPTRGINANLCCTVFVSYCEVYNDIIYDLLDDSERKSKTLRQDSATGNAYIEGAKEVEVQSVDEAMELFLRAQFNRTTASTTLNSNSSRSHSVFSIRLVSAPCSSEFYPSVNSRVHVAEMTIVDLAGSERAKRTDNVGDRMVESGKINQSLLVLRQCFEKMRENRRRRDQQPIPYRDCKLTMLFRSYFEGRGRIRMIICVNPCEANYEENVFVMNFAEMAKTTKIVLQQQQPAYNLEDLANLPYSAKELARWNRELRESVGKLEPHIIYLFDNKPVIELGGPDDDQSITHMREYYTKALKLKHGYFETVKKNTEEWLEILKKRLLTADLNEIQYNNLKNDLEELRNTNTKLISERNYLRKENDVVRIKLSKYEVDLANDRRRGEDENAKVRQASAVYEKQRHALRQVENILETPVSSNALSSGDSVSNVAQIRKRFDRNETEIRKSSRNRNASRPPMSKQASATPHPTRNDNISFMNQRFHRRSQSAAPVTGGRVLDHQTIRKIPTGTIFQPALPSNTRHTTRPSTEDFKKCTDYVLNKQVLDSKGNLRTDLYKGKVIPTAGGGSAVLFDDVEVLVHDTPV